MECSCTMLFFQELSISFVFTRFKSAKGDEKPHRTKSFCMTSVIIGCCIVHLRESVNDDLHFARISKRIRAGDLLS